MPEQKEHPAWRRCPQCLETVPYKVKICPNCKSYQDWRRFAALGQTNLALIVALISVLTTLLNVGIPLLQPWASRITIVYHPDTIGSESDYPGTGPPKVTFYARNDGRTGGLVRVTAFTAKAKADTSTQLLRMEPVYVAAGKEEKLDALLPEANLVEVCKTLNGGQVFDELKSRRDLNIRGVYRMIRETIQCSFSYAETSFGQTSNFGRQVVPCDQIEFVKWCYMME
jgi:hypothetical protein